MSNPLVNDDLPEMGEPSVRIPVNTSKRDPKDDFDPRLIDPFNVHRSNLVFPGMDGLPFRGGTTPDLKESDPEHRQPQIGTKVGVKQLDLSIQTDLEYYQNILQMVANGTAQISFEERVYGDDIKSWRVLIRWVEYYYFQPTSQADGFRR
jgi:hypothetical protein